MKKLLTICLIFFICLTSIEAQEAKTDKVLHHEFGLDLTDFVRQFLFNNNAFFPSVQNVTESYTLSYRLMYKDQINLRLGIGGNISDGETTIDSLSYDLSNKDFRYRIGVDRIQRISKRWEAYYGLDFFQESDEVVSSYISANNNYVRERTQSNNRSGFSPLIGVRFKFNDRIGLQTSLNAEFYKNSGTLTDNYKVLDSNLGAVLPTDETYSDSSKGLDVNIPINLVLTFKL